MRRRDSTMFRGIILDPPLSAEILHALDQSGHIKQIKSPKATGINTVGDIARLSNTPFPVRDRELRQEALLFLALFSEVHLYARMQVQPFTLGDIQEQLNIQLLDFHPDEFDAWTITGLRAKAEIIADRIRLEENPRRKPISVNLSGLFTQQDLADLDLFDGMLDAELSESSFGVDSALNWVRNIARDPDIVLVYARRAKEEHGLPEKHFTLYLRYLVWHVRERLTDIRSLARYTEDLKEPSTWSPGGNILNRAVAETRTAEVPKTDEVILAIRVLLRTVRFVPDISSVEDALQIRESRELASLRSVLSDWTEAMKAGDLAAEADIRQAIERATDAMRWAGRCRAVAGLSTYLAVPVTIGEALLGMPPVAGLTAGIVGASSQAIASVSTWRNKWVLLGSQTPRVQETEPTPPDD